MMGEEWRSFPLEATDSEIFRVISTTTVDRFNSCWLSQYYPTPEPGGVLLPYKRLRPSVEPEMFLFPIPPLFLARTYVLRTLSVKWHIPYYPTPWEIEIQEFF